MRSLFVLLALLVVSTAQAAVDAVIQGPAEAFVGDLVVLNCGASVGDNKVWIVDPAAVGKTIECADTLAFAVGTPGRYEFTLVVADKEADIDFDRFVVVVNPQGSTPGPVDPPPIGDPPVTPPADVAAFIALSRDKAAALGDNFTALALADALRVVITGSAANPLPDARAAVAAAFEATMLGRTGASRDKDWLRGWRMPINEAIDKAVPTTTAHYLAIVSAVEQGLRPSSASENISKVVMFSRPGCIYCDRWKLLVMPELLDKGWTVEFGRDDTEAVPYFDICAYGRCTRYDGYMDLNTFSRIVRSLEHEN